jgi:hypothetical protein
MGVTHLKQNEENLLIDGNMDRKVILNQLVKQYEFKDKKKNQEYVYEVFYLVNTTLPRVGTILTEDEVLETLVKNKIQYEIKSNKATVVR